MLVVQQFLIATLPHYRQFLAIRPIARPLPLSVKDLHNPPLWIPLLYLL